MQKLIGPSNKLYFFFILYITILILFYDAVRIFKHITYKMNYNLILL